MIPDLTLQNLLSWFVQVTAIAFIGTALPKIFRVRHAGSRLTYCYVLLIACIVLPFVEPWQQPGAPSSMVAIVGAANPGVSAILSTVSLEQIVAILLAGGVLLKLCFFFAGLLRLRHYRQTAIPLQFPKESILSICTLLNRKVDIGVSAHRIGPVTLGWLRPMILLPDSFLGLEEEAQQAILCHELLHVTRNDWLANIAEELIGAVLWFHPGVWWLLNQTKLAREQLVDAEVIRLTDAPGPYVEALLTMAGTRSGHFVPAPSFLGRRHLTERLQLLLSDRPISHLRVIASYSLIAMALSVVSWSGFRSFPLMAQPLPVSIPQTPADLHMPREVVYSLADGVLPPRVLTRVDPEYSDVARESHIQGAVLLEGTVLPDGTMKDLKVVRSLHPQLDHSALHALKQWKFEPGKLKEVSVPVRLVVEVHFSLR